MVPGDFDMSLNSPIKLDQANKSGFAISQPKKLEAKNISNSELSGSQDSFIAEIEEEEKKRKARSKFFEDDEEIIIPAGMKKMLNKKNKNLKTSLMIQEEEQMLKKMRIEIVKRETLEEKDSKLTSAQSFSNMNASKISSLIKNFEEDDSEDENDDYINPFDVLKERRNSPKAENDSEIDLNLIDYSFNSQNSNLIKVVKLNQTLDNEMKHATKKNTYYKPPRRVEFNIERNFGTDQIHR
mmetsp:Transcript_15529/g.13569  ORF Transcript_15529/g.13569 Transcript_15529/m.13569 type:complete len:240 (+) Transcript_15529:309-1028(+)